MAGQFEEMTGINKNSFGWEGGIFQMNLLPQDDSLSSCWWPGIETGYPCIDFTAAEKIDGKLQPEHSQPPACLVYRGFKLFSFHFPNTWYSLQFDVQMKCISLIELGFSEAI